MIRGVRTSYLRSRKIQVLCEKIIEGGIRVGTAAGMGDALEYRRAFPGTAKPSGCQFHQSLFLGELGLVQVRVEIATDDKALHHRHRRRNHVAHMVEDLI